MVFQPPRSLSSPYPGLCRVLGVLELGCAHHGIGGGRYCDRKAGLSGDCEIVLHSSPPWVTATPDASVVLPLNSNAFVQFLADEQVDRDKKRGSKSGWQPTAPSGARWACDVPLPQRQCWHDSLKATKRNCYFAPGTWHLLRVQRVSFDMSTVMDHDREALIKGAEEQKITLLRGLISAAKATVERTRGVLLRLGGQTDGRG
jgi:hypothetical protein